MRLTTLLGSLALTAALTAAGVHAAPQLNPHIGHVMTKFFDTPEGMGLLPTAQAEAQVAAQHAALAGRSPDNLSSMQMHTGHVLHAIDPTLEERGPGKGYGVKKAAEGVVAHIGLAANTEGASANIKTHAAHVTASAETVVARCDQIIELAKQIRAASTAAEAAPLVARMATLAEQLTTGADANGDGQIGWQAGEGGLQQAEQHMQLMIKGEGGHP